MKTRNSNHGSGPNRISTGSSRAGRVGAFTLIELILVMTILTVVISLTAPALANFFRGRSLDSEARRLLALTRQGQSRAISEGIPMDLWLDAQGSMFGLEAEPSYEPEDRRAVEFPVDPGLVIETVSLGRAQAGAATTSFGGSRSLRNTESGTRAQTKHAALPRIRFLPDGSFTQDSPQAIVLTGRDGYSMTVSQSRNGLSYEIGAAKN